MTIIYVRISNEKIHFYNPQPSQSFFRVDKYDYLVSDDGYFGQRVHNIRKCKPYCSCKT